MAIVLAHIDCPAIQRGWRWVAIKHTFHIHAGDVIWLQGNNGRGKSTLLNMLAGIVLPQRGVCRVFDAHGKSVDARDCLSAINYLAHSDGVHTHLTVAEHLQQATRLLPTTQRAQTLAQTIDDYGFTPLLSYRAGVLSRGQQRRLAIAMACMAPRQLRLLDEPTIGLDQKNVAQFVALQQQYIAQGGTVVFTSHVPLPDLTVTRHIVLQ